MTNEQRQMALASLQIIGGCVQQLRLRIADKSEPNEFAERAFENIRAIRATLQSCEPVDVDKLVTDIYDYYIAGANIDSIVGSIGDIYNFVSFLTQQGYLTNPTPLEPIEGLEDALKDLYEEKPVDEETAAKHALIVCEAAQRYAAQCKGSDKVVEVDLEQQKYNKGAQVNTYQDGYDDALEHVIRRYHNKVIRIKGENK